MTRVYKRKTHCKRGHLRIPENLTKSGACKICSSELSAEWVKAHPERFAETTRLKNRRHREQNKLEVLTHYGKGGRLQCCWEGCHITDIDMLTLDHVNDDGKEHMNVSGTRRLASDALYIWARKNGYPSNLQTLCGGHQMKKLIMHSRTTRL